MRALGVKSIFRRNRWLVSMQPLSYTSKNRKRKKESWEREEPDIMEDKGIDGFM